VNWSIVAQCHGRQTEQQHAQFYFAGAVRPRHTACCTVSNACSFSFLSGTETTMLRAHARKLLIWCEMHGVSVTWCSLWLLLAAADLAAQLHVFF
jgi:hypothetical protein